MINKFIFASEVDASLDGWTFDKFTIKIDYYDKVMHDPKCEAGLQRLLQVFHNI